MLWSPYTVVARERQSQLVRDLSSFFLPCKYRHEASAMQQSDQQSVQPRTTAWIINASGCTVYCLLISNSLPQHLLTLSLVVLPRSHVLLMWTLHHCIFVVSIKWTVCALQVWVLSEKLECGCQMESSEGTYVTALLCWWWKLSSVVASLFTKRDAPERVALMY